MGRGDAIVQAAKAKGRASRAYEKAAATIVAAARSDCGNSVYASCASTGLRRRRIARPIAPKPSSIIAQVLGSGTAGFTLKLPPYDAMFVSKLPPTRIV